MSSQKKEKDTEKWLGKKISTLGINNWLFIKKYERGAKIRMKKQGELIINNAYLQDISFEFRDLAKLHTENELDVVAYKFPKTKEFIERLKKGKVDYDEMKEIEENYNKKIKIVEALEKNG